MTNSFKNLPLRAEILTNLEQLKYFEMTPIQEQSLPFILNGNDVIGEAKTGSGKTAAFGLGIINRLHLESKHLQALILCPTRELASQVADELRRLARLSANCKILVISGGASEYEQLNSLDHGVHIIVGTPGRVLKFLKQKAINAKAISFLVLDEADRMLDMGFNDDILEIISYTPEKKQSLLFSATFPPDILELSSSFQKTPKIIKIDTKHVKNNIRQIFIEVKESREKNQALLKILDEFRPTSSIIFCKTKQNCAEVTKFLNNEGIAALAMHGDLDQNERTIVLTKFSNKSCLVLVATDVAARGLDIKELEAVVNYDLPIDSEVYTHRIGRTARAGNTGLAFSLFHDYEKNKINEIESNLEVENEYLDLASINPTEKFNLKALMTTIYINGGKKDKIRPGDILGALINEVGLVSSDVGNISILNTQSYVAILSEHVKLTINKLNIGKIKGKKFKVGLA